MSGEAQELFLFEEFAEKPREVKPKVVTPPKKEVEAPRKEEQRPPIHPNVITKPKKHFALKEYMEMFCGNTAAAYYWWEKDQKNLQAENRRETI